MFTVRNAVVPWRECHFVTITNAARIAGRTPGWVADCLSAGDLEGFRLSTAGRPLVISTESLARLLDRAERAKVAADAMPERPKPRLVVSNP